MTITVCAYNRPEYLQRVLASLDTALLACPEYAAACRVWIGIDPGGDREHDVRITAFDWTDHMPWRVHGIIWPEHLGVSEAPRRLLQHVFSTHLSSYNVHLEDDTVLSPDALRLAYWHYTSLERKMVDTFLSLHTANRNIYACPRTVTWRPDFGVWGWGCSYLMWSHWLSKHWNEKLTEPLGWDWAASRLMRQHGLWAVQPVLSRVRNIGRLGGVHATPETYDREHDCEVAAGPEQITDIGDFILSGTQPARPDWAYGE